MAKFRPEMDMSAPRPLDQDALVFVLIGASAVGKSTLAQHLNDFGVVETTPTLTTRKPRTGENSSSCDHIFVSDEEFDAVEGMIAVRSIYGARYGLPHPQAPAEGKEALVVLKPAFVPVFLDHFPAARIYQIESAVELLRDRMEARGQDHGDINERMRHHAEESAEAQRVAEVVFNNNASLEPIFRQVRQQIKADRAVYQSRRRRP